MGRYTEILIKADLKRDTPDDVKEILHYLFNRTRMQWGDDLLPDHEFFKCHRWEFIGSCSSFYHVPWATSRYDENTIFSRSDLKNYGGEIAKFFNWIQPYIEATKGQCIGYSWYEEDMQPELYYKTVC